MSEKVEWGVGFGRFSLSAPREILERAKQLLALWRDSAEGDLLGEWSVCRQGDRWRLSSPDSLRDFLKAWNAPDLYDCPEHVIKAVEFQATAQAILWPHSPLGMHGALLSLGGKGLVVVGDKEAGKSTLSAALWQAGFDFASDDGFFLDETNLRARPVPRRSRLRASSRELLGEALWSELSRRPTSSVDADGHLLFHPQTQPVHGKLASVVLLHREPGPIEELSAADALVELARHSYRFVVSGAAASLRQLQPLTTRVPCFRMGRAGLEEQVERVQRLLA